jgi:CspA family cold shock protein
MTIARVKWFSDPEGWGVLEAPDAPGDIFVHFSDIAIDGYRTLRTGQIVETELEGPLDFDQDGCRWRAHNVRPVD